MLPTKMLSIKNVTKIYNGEEIQTQALNNISFEVDKGEFVAIMGPSGSGKSTLMHILGALDLPTSGSYSINGVNIEKMKEDELSEIRNKRIGFVFQAYNLLSRTSALKNVMLPMVYAGIKRKDQENRAKEMLELVGLGNKLNNKPNQLSGGQKQRVAIARALVMNPDIILADEPTGNLATSQSEEIMNIFTDLNQKGHTIIIITHEEDIAKKTKRIITLVDGKITEDKRI